MTEALILLILGILGCALGWFLDARGWNGGICAKTGESWKHFDNDSQGGRGYKSGPYTLWVSWPVDRNATARPGR